MNVSSQLNKLIKMTMLALIVSGSAEISAQATEVQAITIIVGGESPDGCELLGKVKGSSKDEATDAAEDNTPYVDRLIKARNNLRNEAQKLGGNNVHVTYYNNTGKYEIPGTDKEIIFAGNVYRCK